jgi:hypothetical protein
MNDACGRRGPAGVVLADAFRFARPDPQPADFARLEGYPLPDEDDRAVFAAALAAEADVICTSNIRHFPLEVAAALGLRVMRPDMLLADVGCQTWHLDGGELVVWTALH